MLRYSETVSLHDELAILSASGTAVRMRLPDEELSKREAGLPPHPAMPLHAGLAAAAAGAGRRVPSPCTIGHTPYAPSDAPFPVRIEPCAMCKRKHVPELLLATIDKPPWLPALKEPCLIQVRQSGPAHRCRRAVVGKVRRNEKGSFEASFSLPKEDPIST